MSDGVVKKCKSCGKKIGSGEYFVEYGNEIYCCDCFGIVSRVDSEECITYGGYHTNSPIPDGYKSRHTDN